MLKLNNQGNTVWVISEGGNGSENVYDVACDGQGDIILTGQFQGSSVIGGQSLTSMINPETNNASYDLFVSKYTAAGNFQWLKTGSGKYEERGMSLTTDTQNNIYLAGQFSDTLIFAGQTYNNQSYNLGLLTKLSPAGSVIWFNTMRSSKVLPYSIKHDGTSVVVTGDCGVNFNYSNNGSPSTQTGTYSKSIFLLKVGENGSKIWLKTLGSENEVSARAVAVGSAKEIYVTGYFSCSWTEFHQPQSAYYNSVGFRDPYLWKADLNGNLQSVKTFGSALDDTGNGVAIIAGNQPVICGGSTANLNFRMAQQSSYNTQTANNFSLRTYTSGSYEYNHYSYLIGDRSLNSFITTAVNDHSPNYNFFKDFSNDSLNCIIPPSDTIRVCEHDTLYIQPQTLNKVGPNYKYVWNTGDSTKWTPVTTSGQYWTKVEREDGCSFGSDTTQVIVHERIYPLMTDSLGIVVNQPGPDYHTYRFCYPDSIAIWFSSLPPTHTITIESGNETFYDTVPRFYSQTLKLTISDSVCISKPKVKIIMDYTSPTTYDPYLTLINDLDHNDSITICRGDAIEIQNHDWNNNPNNITNLFPSVHYDANSWTAYYNGSSVASSYEVHGGGEGRHNQGYEFDFTPNQTGYYIIKLNASIGYDNYCGLDTTKYIIIDTFYVEVLSNPTIPNVTIEGDNLLCPNGSIYLSVDTTVTSFNWFGPGIQWKSTDKDSCQITQPGTYYYKGTYTDTLTGCDTQGMFYHTVVVKSPPIIETNPMDGIVCPYDSVYMYVDDEYLSYSWSGPGGDSLSSTFHHTDELLGFYTVTVVDDEGCELTSPQAELKEFTTPYLFIEPDNVICRGETTSIKVIMEGDGAIQWVNPANAGSSNQLTVSQAGWYVCQISQCGITITDSIQVIDGSFSVNLNLNDTTICSSDSVLLIAPSGYSVYEWSNGEVDLSSIWVSSAGAYYVYLENEYGCGTNTPGIVISEINNDPPTTIPDVLLCDAGNTILQTNQYVV